MKTEIKRTQADNLASREELKALKAKNLAFQSKIKFLKDDYRKVELENFSLRSKLEDKEKVIQEQARLIDDYWNRQNFNEQDYYHEEPVFHA